MAKRGIDVKNVAILTFEKGTDPGTFRGGILCPGLIVLVGSTRAQILLAEGNVKVVVEATVERR